MTANIASCKEMYVVVSSVLIELADVKFMKRLFQNFILP
jgi:hypothetical protein